MMMKDINLICMLLIYIMHLFDSHNYYFHMNEYSMYNGWDKKRSLLLYVHEMVKTDRFVTIRS